MCCFAAQCSHTSNFSGVLILERENINSDRGEHSRTSCCAVWGKGDVWSECAYTHTYSHSLTYIYTPIHYDYANIYSLVSLIKDDGNTDAGMNALEHHISPIL